MGNPLKTKGRGAARPPRHVGLLSADAAARPGFFAHVSAANPAKARNPKMKGVKKARPTKRIEADAATAAASADTGAARKVKSAKKGLVVAGTAELEELAGAGSGSGGNPQAAGPYSSSDRILLVGEGNFTFAASLALALGGSKVVASSLDLRKEVLSKYEAVAKEALLELKLGGAKVFHGIDATNPEQLKVCLGQWTRFDVVGFNFPHLGGATAEAVDANREMLSKFFAAAKRVVSDQDGRGRICVSLRTTSFYRSWRLEELAKAQGLKLVSRMPFAKDQYLGYQEARTNPAARESPDTDDAVTYIFREKAGKKSFARTANKRGRGGDARRQEGRKGSKTGKKRKLT